MNEDIQLFLNQRMKVIRHPHPKDVIYPQRPDPD